MANIPTCLWQNRPDPLVDNPTQRICIIDRGGAIYKLNSAHTDWEVDTAYVEATGLPTTGTPYALAANNLSDVTAATARTNLGLGTSVTKDVPATGDATTAQVVLGTDTRLAGNARTANNLSDLASAVPALRNLTIRAGVVTITTPATSATVAFTSAVASVDYAVVLTQDGASFIATNPTITNKTVNGFDIILSAGLTVTYDYLAIAKA